jgi:hypothetical protein
MRRGLFAVGLALLAAAPVAAGDDPVERARQLYNQRKFADAIKTAEQARTTAGRRESADLVAARAYLERYRDSAASDDLTNARERLRRLDPQRLAPRERIEYVVGLGETLYFDESYGAAAAVFDSVLQTKDAMTVDARDRVLDWWADAVDREGRPRPEIERRLIYQRIRSRMEDEIALHPTSTTAAYWLAAAARNQGDLQAAWDAAEAAWVRAPLTSDKGAAIRADIDSLVLHAIIPERARVTAQSPDKLRLDWEQFKEKWKK